VNVNVHVFSGEDELPEMIGNILNSPDSTTELLSKCLSKLLDHQEERSHTGASDGKERLQSKSALQTGAADVKEKMLQSSSASSMLQADALEVKRGKPGTQIQRSCKSTHSSCPATARRLKRRSSRQRTVARHAGQRAAIAGQLRRYQAGQCAGARCAGACECGGPCSRRRRRRRVADGGDRWAELFKCDNGDQHFQCRGRDQYLVRSMM